MNDEFYHNGRKHKSSYESFCKDGGSVRNDLTCYVSSLAAALTSGESTFVDGGVVAAARTLPTWSDGDLPAIPSVERKSAQALQEECRKMSESFSTTIQQDEQILGNMLLDP